MSSSRRTIGKGFASLIPDEALGLDVGGARPQPFRTVPLDEIRPNPEQPRDRFESEDMTSLTESVKRHGILSPLVVRRHEGRYVLIAGERRLRAAAMAGLKEVPVVVREADRPSEQLELALIENLQRADLDPVEAARGFARLVEDYGYTQDEVAQRVGKDRATVANALRLLKLPDYVLMALRDRKLSSGHARALIPVTDGALLRALVERIPAEGLSVRALEKIVAQWAKQKGSRPKPAPVPAKPARTDYAERMLERSLQTAVKIETNAKGGGRIVIDFTDREELERLLGRMGGGEEAAVAK